MQWVILDLAFLRGCDLLIAHVTVIINITHALLWPLDTY